MEPTVTETAPSSTAEVASNVIDAFEQSSDGVDVSGDTPSPETPTPEATAAADEAPAKELSDEEALLQEFGFKQAFKPDGREHYIARSKVLSMIASGLKRGREKWTGEKTTLDGQITELRGYLNQLRAGVAGDEAAFLRELAQIDPRYGRFLEPPKPEPPAPAVSAEMPAPDLSLPDGSRTYSLEGIQKLLDWKTSQVESKLLSAVESKLKPLTEREKQAEQAQAFRERTRQQIDEAKTWPGFAEHESDILKALQEDSARARAAGKRPSLTLEAAYRKVVIPRLSADRNKMREELIKELNAAPKGTATTKTGGAETAKPTGPMTTQDIATRTLARLERQQ